MLSPTTSRLPRHINSSKNELESRDNRFKSIYFRLQDLINHKVTVSVKYESLKSSEIHSTLLRPLLAQVIKAGSKTNASRLQFTLKPYLFSLIVPDKGKSISQKVVFILLLLRYEFMIQSENNLICYDLLITKANVCELLAIRVLREYKSDERTNLLFISPYTDLTFNTLELAVLSKSKKFLCQPIIVQILDRFYNGDVLLKSESLQLKPNDVELQLLVNSNKGISKYQFKKTSISMVKLRSEIVPKYQSLVINLKFMLLTFFYFLTVLKYKYQKTGLQFFLTESLFWLFVMDLNLETVLKLMNIRFRFLRKIIWTFTDIVLAILLSLLGMLRLYLILTGPYPESNYIQEFYMDTFSITSIILIPRLLAVFNNYEFFNLIIISAKKMIWKVAGLFCLFIAVTSGFYVAFISLSRNRDGSLILFDMIKVFFGFTPAIWDNWKNYNTIGRTTQMGYLFLVQFVVSTILAIVLSDIFLKISAANKEEFNYFKAANIVIYRQSAKVFTGSRSTSISYPTTLNRLNYVTGLLFHITNKALYLFKFPIIVAIFLYELLISKIYTNNLLDKGKNFTFLQKTNYELDNDHEGVVGLRSRKNSTFEPPPQVADRKTSVTSTFRNSLVPTQSRSTIGIHKSASTDSIFIDEILQRRYGKLQQTFKSGYSDIEEVCSGSNGEMILSRLDQIEILFKEHFRQYDFDRLIDEVENEGEVEDEIDEEEEVEVDDIGLVTSVDIIDDSEDDKSF